MKMFSEFGFPDLGLSEQDFLEEEIVVEVAREPLNAKDSGLDGY